MYVVKIINGDVETLIHDEEERLLNGKINKGINTIDSFVFTILPSNAGFYLLNEFSTLISVYDTNKRQYDFVGRVLYAETTMSESGLISKTVTCESVAAYLCDSWQMYVDLQNWTVSGLLQHIIECHNLQVEEYKHFKIGIVTAYDLNDNLYEAIQRENTWNAIKSKLIEKIGGEIYVRLEDDGLYLDYLDKIGESKQTALELSINMKSITKEQDPSSFITRLIPLGCKLADDTEERLDIASVNNGVIYIDDTEAIAVYGVHVGVVEWDDVTIANNLVSKGKNWLESNNKVAIKYSITALDLSLIGLAFDSFEVGNTYPIKNSLLGIDDVARVIKKSIDICEEVKSTIEVGDALKTLSDIQKEQSEQIKNTLQNAQKVEQQMATDFVAINKKIEEIKANLRQEISDTKKELSDDITQKTPNLSAKIDQVVLELEEKINELESKIESLTT